MKKTRIKLHEKISRFMVLSWRAKIEMQDSNRYIGIIIFDIEDHCIYIY